MPKRSRHDPKDACGREGLYEKQGRDFAAAAEVSVAATSGNVTLALSQGGADVVYISNSGRLHTGRSHELSGDIYVFGGEGRINVVTSSGDLGIK